MDLLHGRNIDKRNSSSVLSGVLSSVTRSKPSALFFEIVVERTVNAVSKIRVVFGTESVVVAGEQPSYFIY